jgi:hypothetical protein
LRRSSFEEAGVEFLLLLTHQRFFILIAATTVRKANNQFIKEFHRLRTAKADGTFVPLSVYSVRRPIAEHGRSNMSVGTIILIILVIALLGGFSGIGGGPFYGTGYYGGGGLGLVVVVLIILLLMGRL